MTRGSFNLNCPCIICEVCDRLVDRIEMHVSMYDDVYVFKVWCHGDTDECRIPATDVMDGLGDYREGRAFTTKRLKMIGAVCRD